MFFGTIIIFQDHLGLPNTGKFCAPDCFAGVKINMFLGLGSGPPQITSGKLIKVTSDTRLNFV